MNEDLKNIETCLPESILAEVASVPTDPQFVSLVNESLDPLKQQAVQQAGSDAYNEVVASHQPYTFTSLVRQMKSNLILLLRRFWRFPFGTGTIRSLADMWQHYITRLQGSETYGIPSRLDQLTDLPSAPLLVADRKISGVPDAADGMSLVHLLCNSAAAAEVVELIDDNSYICTKALNCHEPIFPNLQKITIGAVENTDNFFYVSGYNAEMPTLQEIHFPNLVIGRDLINTNAGTSGAFHPGFANVTTMTFPKLREIKAKGNSVSIFTAFFSRTVPSVTKIEMPELVTLNNYFLGGKALTGLQELRLPKLKYANYAFFNTYQSGDGCPNLLLLEVGAVETNLNISFWSPTLDSSNLQQFLSNFRSFIVLRLANRKTTSALTLTLSANVYNAVTGANSGWASQHTLAELGITDNDLTDLETELGITSATIYATWLDTYTGANGIHWDINKAN